MEQADADAILGRLTTGTREICADCDLVVEAAVENMAIKRQMFEELDKLCKEGCVLATNTSSL